MSIERGNEVPKVRSGLKSRLEANSSMTNTLPNFRVVGESENLRMADTLYTVQLHGHLHRTSLRV